jgi:DNA-binding GntR family transcriptional regulator
MSTEDLARLDAAEERFAGLTLELRAQMRAGEAGNTSLVVVWMAANHAFHDVIYDIAALPRVELLAKSARRTFIGEHVWNARGELDELFARNDLQHRAIREAIAAGSPDGARTLAREHVLSSGRLMEAALDLAAARARPPDWLANQPELPAWETAQ